LCIKAAGDLDNIKQKFTIYMRHTKFIQKQNGDDLCKEKAEYQHLYSGFLDLMLKNGETKDAYTSLQIANEALKEEYNALEIEFNDLAKRFSQLEKEEEALEKEVEAEEKSWPLSPDFKPGIVAPYKAA
jgi:predicted nuclease with TOPRIM domain